MDRSAPRLVLLDPDHWDALELLALALRGRGLDVVRLVPNPDQVKGRARWADRVLGGRIGALPELGSAESLDRWMCAPTADVQGPEAVMSAWWSRGTWPESAAGRRVAHERHTHLLFDKLAMNHFAEGLGIGVPATWTTPPVDRLPLVVKRVSGSGGRQVRMAWEHAQVGPAVREVDPDARAGVFFQEFVPGVCETFGGVADAGVLLTGATYRTFPSASDPLGPAERIEITDSAHVREQVQRLCRALGYTGFICVDFITRPDGSAVLIDVNPRVFGSWLALQQAGIDLLGAYLSLFGLASARVEQATIPAGCVRVVRHMPEADIDGWREWAAATGSSVRSVSSAARVVGWRYAVVGGGRGAARSASSAARLLKRRTPA